MVMLLHNHCIILCRCDATKTRRDNFQYLFWKCIWNDPFFVISLSPLRFHINCLCRRVNSTHIHRAQRAQWVASSERNHSILKKNSFAESTANNSLDQVWSQYKMQHINNFIPFSPFFHSSPVLFWLLFFVHYIFNIFLFWISTVDAISAFVYAIHILCGWCENATCKRHNRHYASI